MPQLRVTLNIEQDGSPLPGFPLVRTQQLDEADGLRTEEKAADNDTTTFTALSTVLSQLQLLFVHAPQRLTFRLDNQSDAGVTLEANGVLLIVNGDLQSTPLVEVNNPHATAAAAMRLLLAGT